MSRSRQWRSHENKGQGRMWCLHIDTQFFNTLFIISHPHSLQAFTTSGWTWLWAPTWTSASPPAPAAQAALTGCTSREGPTPRGGNTQSGSQMCARRISGMDRLRRIFWLSFSVPWIGMWLLCLRFHTGLCVYTSPSPCHNWQKFRGLSRSDYHAHLQQTYIKIDHYACWTTNMKSHTKQLQPSCDSNHLTSPYVPTQNKFSFAQSH